MASTQSLRKVIIKNDYNQFLYCTEHKIKKSPKSEKTLPGLGVSLAKTKCSTF